MEAKDARAVFTKDILVALQAISISGMSSSSLSSLGGLELAQGYPPLVQGQQTQRLGQDQTSQLVVVPDIWSCIRHGQMEAEMKCVSVKDISETKPFLS
jgi:hypothetical protein